MYKIVNKNNEIIAFNKRYDVCIKYINNLNRTYEDNNDYFENELIIQKIKNKKAKQHPDFNDLYLIRYNDTYIQSGYTDYLTISGEQVFYDNKYALDVLVKFLDTDYPMSKKDKKHIEHTIAFLFNVIKDDKLYTPSLKDLKAMEEHYSSYAEIINSPYY